VSTTCTTTRCRKMSKPRSPSGQHLRRSSISACRKLRCASRFCKQAHGSAHASDGHALHPTRHTHYVDLNLTWVSYHHIAVASHRLPLSLLSCHTGPKLSTSSPSEPVGPKPWTRTSPSAARQSRLRCGKRLRHRASWTRGCRCLMTRSPRRRRPRSRESLPPVT
jgi:hypothetical protein